MLQTITKNSTSTVSQQTGTVRQLLATRNQLFSQNCENCLDKS